jgi:hypothetical protein
MGASAVKVVLSDEAGHVVGQARRKEDRWGVAGR